MKVGKPESVGLSSQRLSRLAQAFSRRIDRRDQAGAATMVARRGKLVHFHVRGLASIESSKPLAEDTIYHIYSMSKPVTAVALLMLMEEGLFQLDEPAAHFVPELGTLKVLEGTADSGPVLVDLERPVTFRHLFTHTAGICYPASTGSPAERLLSEAMGGDVFCETPLTLERWVKLLVRAPLTHQPGAGWTYGFSMDVMGRLVEVLSGMTFDRFLQERLFGPLGMKDTSFCVPDEKLSRLAAVYGRSDAGELQEVEWASRGYGTKPVFLSGGGGLFSTGPDYLRFAQMLVNGGALDGARILGRRTVDLMRMCHVAQLADLPAVRSGDAFDPGCTFGLGGRVVADESKGLFGSRGTYGWDGLAGTSFFVDPVEELTGLFFTQINPWPDRLLEQFRTLVYQALE
jgi:CubicO group peptidase (beta-lactamase class C family)